MNNQHQFIFKPGIWIGEGKVTFSSSPEHVNFYTKWIVSEPDSNGSINCQQLVEIRGVTEKVFNEVLVYQIYLDHFLIKLENNMLGSVVGKGVIDEKTIAWEYRGENQVDGFEIYHLQENGDYILHAEYASPKDEYRTIIDGLIWKKSTQ